MRNWGFFSALVRFAKKIVRPVRHSPAKKNGTARAQFSCILKFPNTHELTSASCSVTNYSMALLHDCIEKHLAITVRKHPCCPRLRDRSTRTDTKIVAEGI